MINCSCSYTFHKIFASGFFLAVSGWGSKTHIPLATWVKIIYKGMIIFIYLIFIFRKSGATSWSYVHVNVMSHININKFKMVEQRLCS